MFSSNYNQGIVALGNFSLLLILFLQVVRLVVAFSLGWLQKCTCTLDRVTHWEYDCVVR